MTMIRTNRLELRPLRAGDEKDITRLIGDWSVIRWLTTPPWPYRIEDAQDFLANMATQTTMGITRNGTFMGVVDISQREEAEDAELGYWLGCPFHGNGYMTEAAAALVGSHFNNGHAGLYSGYISGNAASHNVLTKLGFLEAGPKQALSRPLARDVEICQMTLTAKRWKARHAARS